MALLFFLLLAVLFIGSEVNGAKSWFIIGGVGFQPSEFAKFASALALAKYMSSFNFKLQTMKALGTVGFILFMPALLIFFQNDTGSALVYFSFFLVLYREGLSGIVLFFGLLAISLFIMTLMVNKLVLLVLLAVVALLVFYFIPA